MKYYALGLDIGVGSIGWSVVALNAELLPYGLEDWGVRIFPSGRKPNGMKDPLAATRREARGIRRRVDRIKLRRRVTMNKLIQHGLMPEEEAARKTLEQLDPLALRAKGAREKLSLHEFGRALFHLQQRRGFKSNRKEQGDNKKEAGALAKGCSRLQEALQEQNVTLGQFLYQRKKSGKNARFIKRAENNKSEYDYYPLRSMVEEEFETLWQTQKKFHNAALNDKAYKEIHRAIFYQRPLKAQPRGKCLFNSEEERVPMALPSMQHLRILKEIHNIRITGVAHPARGIALTQAQKDALYEKLLHQGTMTEKTVRTALKLASEEAINLFAGGVRSKLQGDETAAEMRKEARYGKGWDKLPLEKQDAIIALLSDMEKLPNENGSGERLLKDEEIIERLVQQHGCSVPQAEQMLHAKIPDTMAKFGMTVTRQMLPLLQQGLSEYEALSELGYQHSRFNTGEIMEQLPYYGAIPDLERHTVPMKSSDPMVDQYGRVSNPTVHLALNQLRKLVNQIVKRYGARPQYITIEMVRDLKKGRKEITEITRQINANNKLRDKYKEEIEAHGLTSTPHYLAKMKLWHELAADPAHRKCVYTGEVISLAQVLSEQTEIEHILPRSRTLDDTAANKTLTFLEVNRMKGEKTPAEFFATPQELRGKTITFEAVLERANSLKDNKKWRFTNEAMDVFDNRAKKIMLGAALGGGEVETGLEGFAARHLIDTSYIAKFAKKYLAYICDKGERGVMAVPGTLTGLLRKAWGMNALIGEVDSKNRSDHRHHAIDALVVALTTPGMVKSVADAAKRAETKGEKLVQHIAKPWDGYGFAQLQARCDAIVVSHKPDHGSPAQGFGTTGQLHDDKAYGLTGLPAKKKSNSVFVMRRTADYFEKVKHLDDIRDAQLRDIIKQYISHALGDCPLDAVADKEVKPLVAKYMQAHGLKGMRCLKERSVNAMIPIANQKTKTPYKYFVGDNNYCADIYVSPNGKQAGKWQVEIISAFNANQKGFVPEWRRENPNAKRVMRLHINDMVALDDASGERIICRVQKINTDGRVFCIPHNVANLEDKSQSKGYGTSRMVAHNFRKVSVRVDGVLLDPKAPKQQAA